MLGLKNDAPHNLILAIAQSFISSRVLILFAETELFSSKKHFSLEEIAKTLSANPKALKRFLRLLIAYKILNKENGLYFLAISLQDFEAIKSLKLAEKYKKINHIFDFHKIHHKFSDESLSTLTQYLEEFQQQQKVSNSALNIAYDFIISRLVIHFAELNFQLNFMNGISSTEKLAEALNFPPALLNKCLHILAEYRIVEFSSDYIKSTPLSDSLPWVLSPHITDAYTLFDKVDNTLQNNDASWAKVFGYNFYQYLNHYPDKLTTFKNWCTVSAIGWLEAVLLWCRFSNINSLVDIGGGSGVFLKRILEINPNIKGVLFEQPSIIQNIDPLFFSSLSERVELVSGDFFNYHTIPKNQDVYIICRTFLNWEDKDVVDILNNCRRVMGQKAKIIIIDFIIPDPAHLRYQRAVLNDISLFTILNSAIRTKEEWESIISKTNLEIVNFKITQDNELPIEYVPYYPMCFIELGALAT